jgi:Cu2+-exporting ATPase
MSFVVSKSNDMAKQKNTIGISSDAGAVTRNFPVLHMSCAACAVSTESMLQSQPGVISAAVNYANASAKVQYLPEMITPVQLQQSLQSIGYDLLIEDDAEESQEEIRRQQFRRLQFRAWGAILLSVPLVVIGMFFMHIPYVNIIMWILSTPVVVITGKPFFVNAWKQAKHRKANMDTLVALSTGVAYIFSVFNTLFPEYWHKRGLHGHVYFEAAAVVIAFVLLGKVLEEKAKGNTSGAIKKLMGLQAKTVHVVQDNGTIEDLAVQSVVAGQVLLVKPGEKIAVDGTVLNGSSYVDESMITGEPVAVAKQAGDKVFAGTLNQKGSFQFRADKVGAATMLGQIIRMVQDAQGSKAPVQQLVDKIAGLFVPVVILIALLSGIAWWWLGGEHGFTQALLSAVTVLVIACPCALGLATPTAIMVGIGKGAELGILIRDAESLEKAGNVTNVLLDKTGTITEGKPVLTDIYWKNKTPELEAALAALEQKSEHPLAEAVVNYLGDKANAVADDFESYTGRGITGTVSGIRYWVGNDTLIKEQAIHIDPLLQEQAATWLLEAKTVVYFAAGQQVEAIIAIADSIKTGSVKAIQQLQAMGIQVSMLTGDNPQTAAAVAKAAGITDYHAGLLPADKADYVKKLQAEGHVVAMVGDGINDSHALAQADVGIAMGKGSDIAMDVAKMTLLGNDLVKIPKAILLSKQTVKTIRQNLFWAFIYNLIGIPVAAGLLYPINGFLLNPMIAGAAMAFSSVSVVSNSLLLKWKKI